jgi:hypothetical protein
MHEHVFVRKRPAPPAPLVARQGRPPAADSSAEIRLCPRHGWIEFHNQARAAGGSVWRCKRCVGEAVTRRKQKIRRVLIDEAGGRCVRCRYDRCIINLTFHHVDRSTKRFSMSSHTGRSLAAFREEAKKCILLCANCHGEVEERARANPTSPRQPITPYRGKRPVELGSCRVHGLTEFALQGVRRPRWRCKKCVVAANRRLRLERR